MAQTAARRGRAERPRGLTRSKATLYPGTTFSPTGEVILFGLGFGEMLLIVAVALIVIGPKKLPGVARTLGRGIAEFKRHADDIQRTLHREIHAPLAGTDLLRSTAAAPVQARPGPPPGETTVQPEPRPVPDPYAQPGPPSPEGAPEPVAAAPDPQPAAAPAGDASAGARG